MKSDLLALMRDANLDALLVLGDALHNPAMVYFTGVAHVTEAALVLKRGEDPILFFNPMERDEAASTGLQTKGFAPYDYRKLFEESGNNAQLAKARLLQLALTDVDLTSGRVAVYGQRDTSESFGLLTALEELMPSLEIVSDYADPVLLHARSTKDEGEIAEMRKIGEQTTEVVAQVADYLASQRAKEGILVNAEGQPITVGNVKSHIFLWLAERGLDNPHGTIFAPGAEGGVPHSTGSPDALLRLGEPIVFDIFPVQAGGGYYFDFTRTWCLGHATDEAQSLYEDVRYVYDTIMRELKMDQLCSLYQDRTCDLFAERGHPTVKEDPQTEVGFVHGLAHGLGLDVHEAPRLSRDATERDLLRAGSVVTIEPGLYYPERGLGCRLEDAVYVRPDGKMEVLAPYPLDLVIPLKS
ncbi:MAG: aminopeptidase P family protein [Chloroflexi bacterium]|nr:Xaa-Pro peptidase family protein [Chloroflexota bacterium]MQC26155.1 aminopeptidase P family protein [Chloroflexota bacterium]